MLDGNKVYAGVLWWKWYAYRRSIRPLQIAPALGDLLTRNLPGMLKHRSLEPLTVELPSLSVGLQDRERLVKTRNLIRHKKSAPTIRLCS